MMTIKLIFTKKVDYQPTKLTSIKRVFR